MSLQLQLQPLNIFIALGTWEVTFATGLLFAPYS
jgi:hypothetical protein